MVRYSKKAEDDIARLYRYGRQMFGEEEADAFLEGLLDAIDALDSNIATYRRLRLGGELLYRAVFKSKSIYYSTDGGVVRIVRILGRQDRTTFL